MHAPTLSPETAAELQRVAAHIATRDDAWSIPPETGRFLHTLVLAGGYQRGLEIGTSFGYSGLWLGGAFMRNGGTLVSLERDPEKVRYAREAFARAGFDSRVTVAQGVAARTIPELDGPFDFVFIDADKENTRRYFDLVWPRLAQRATVATDNILSHADQMADFAAYLRSHPELSSALVPIGSGVEVSVRVGVRRGAGIDGADWVI